MAILRGRSYPLEGASRFRDHRAHYPIGAFQGGGSHEGEKVPPPEKSKLIFHTRYFLADVIVAGLMPSAIACAAHAVAAVEIH